MNYGQTLCVRRRGVPKRPDVHRCVRCDQYTTSSFDACNNCRERAPEISQEWNTKDALTAEFYAYILYLSNGTFYPGQTRDLRQRVKDHQAGNVSSTSGLDPELVWFNAVKTRQEAADIEFILKHMPHNKILNLVNNYNAAVNGVLPNLSTQRDVDALRLDIVNNIKKHVDRVVSAVVLTGIALGILMVILKFV